MPRRILLAALLLLAIGPSAQAAGNPAQAKLGEEVRAINPRYLLAGPDGQAVSNEDFPGRFQLITFGYTYCPDICPTTLVEMAEILRLLGERARQVQPIFISVDPERDTPPVLKNYTRFFDPRIVGLTGSPQLVSRAAQNFKIRYAKVAATGGDPANYAVDHSAGMFLLGPEGQFIKKFGFGSPAAEIAGDIESAMAGTGNPRQP